MVTAANIFEFTLINLPAAGRYLFTERPLSVQPAQIVSEESSLRGNVALIASPPHHLLISSGVITKHFACKSRWPLPS